MKEMKKTTVAIVMMSLMLTCVPTALGQSKSRVRAKPAPVGGQICTGCCDPCYSDDGWNIRQPQQPATGNPHTVNPAGKSTHPAKTRKGRR